MYILDILTRVLACVGAINWGLIAVFELNLVTALFGIGPITNAVYIIVGVSGLFQFFNIFKTASMTQRISTHSENSQSGL